MLTIVFFAAYCIDYIEWLAVYFLIDVPINAFDLDVFFFSYVQSDPHFVIPLSFFGGIFVQFLEFGLI